MSSIEVSMVLQVLVPAAAAYLSVKVSLAVALERANNALKSADEAHKRIDKLHQILNENFS